MGGQDARRTAGETPALQGPIRRVFNNLDSNHDPAENDI